MLREPLSADDAKRLARQILATGNFVVSSHAEEEMVADNLILVDCLNVFRAGFVEGHDLIRGTWRYRFTTGRITVVVTFRSEHEMTLVTAWRAKR